MCSTVCRGSTCSSNNVGGYWDTRHLTVDGLEHTFALNHLAPFLLTNLLRERLQHSAPARVVTVASGAHTTGRIDFDDLQGEHSYSGSRAYSQSKLANILFTHELSGRLRGNGVTANALHPGFVRTSFGADDPGAIQRLLVPFFRPFMRSPEQGAERPSTWRRRQGYRRCPVSTSRTASPGDPRTPATTWPSQRGFGRSAPIWSPCPDRGGTGSALYALEHGSVAQVSAGHNGPT